MSGPWTRMEIARMEVAGLQLKVYYGVAWRDFVVSLRLWRLG